MDELPAPPPVGKQQIARQIRVADYVFDFFALHGVRSVFLVPGGGSMFLVDAVAKNTNLDFVASHHEQASVIAAEAYARVGGGIGVAVVTTGPGATNALTGITGAWLESVPVFVLSGQVKRADLMGKSGLRQRGPQEVDIVTMVRGVTKYAVTVMDALDIRFHLEEALHRATSGRNGPVLLDIPLDVQAATIDPALLRGFVPESAARRAPDALRAQVDSVIELLNAAQRPLLFAGHGVRLAGAAAAFTELYERLNIPVAVSWPAMDLIASSHRLSVGKPGAVAQRSANFVVQNSDLIVMIGLRLDNSVTAFNRAAFGRNACRVVVDIDAAELAKFDQNAYTTIEADAGEFLAMLLERSGRIKANERSDWHDHCRALARRYPLNDDQTDRRAARINHHQVTQVLSEHIPGDTLIITGSSGLAIEFLYTGFQTKTGQRVMHSAGLGAMGYGLPAMVGAAIAHGKPLVGIESDGSLMFNLQELLTVRTLNLPLCLFILNNAGYASMRNMQRNYFEGRYVGTGPEAKLVLADVVAFGKTIGIPGMTISDSSELDGQICYALAQPRPFICDIMLEPNETLWPKVAAMPMPDGTIISMPLEDMSPLLSLDELQSNLLGAIDPASESVRAIRDQPAT